MTSLRTSFFDKTEESIGAASNFTNNLRPGQSKSGFFDSGMNIADSPNEEKMVFAYFLEPINQLQVGEKYSRV